MISIIASSAPGLSPLARGTLTAWYAESHPERFIPAGAGNTEASNIWWTKRTVYPRWRGEHCTRRVLATGHPGLSPLARGTRICQRLCGAVNRFIPAGAGNTTPATCFASRSAVYPRWRGEHVIANRGEINRCGLSPLARGTQNWISLRIPRPCGRTPSSHFQTHQDAFANSFTRGSIIRITSRQRRSILPGSALSICC